MSSSASSSSAYSSSTHKQTNKKKTIKKIFFTQAVKVENIDLYFGLVKTRERSVCLYDGTETILIYKPSEKVTLYNGKRLRHYIEGSEIKSNQNGVLYEGTTPRSKFSALSKKHRLRDYGKSIGFEFKFSVCYVKLSMRSQVKGFSAHGRNFFLSRLKGVSSVDGESPVLSDSLCSWKGKLKEKKGRNVKKKRRSKKKMSSHASNRTRKEHSEIIKIDLQDYSEAHSLPALYQKYIINVIGGSKLCCGDQKSKIPRERRIDVRHLVIESLLGHRSSISGLLVRDSLKMDSCDPRSTADLHVSDSCELLGMAGQAVITKSSDLSTRRKEKRQYPLVKIKVKKVPRVFEGGVTASTSHSSSSSSSSTSSSSSSTSSSSSSSTSFPTLPPIASVLETSSIPQQNVSTTTSRIFRTYSLPISQLPTANEIRTTTTLTTMTTRRGDDMISTVLHNNEDSLGSLSVLDDYSDRESLRRVPHIMVDGNIYSVSEYNQMISAFSRNAEQMSERMTVMSPQINNRETDNPFSPITPHHLRSFSAYFTNSDLERVYREDFFPPSSFGFTPSTRAMSTRNIAVTNFETLSEEVDRALRESIVQYEREREHSNLSSDYTEEIKRSSNDQREEKFPLMGISGREVKDVQCKDSKENTACVVCLENIPFVVLVKCGHNVCYGCTTVLQVEDNRCPVCRKQIDCAIVPHNYETILSSGSVREKRQRDGASTEDNTTHEKKKKQKMKT